MGSWGTERGIGTAPGASGGALDEELELTHGGPADVEHGPGGCQHDRGENQKEPEIHGGSVREWGDFKERRSFWEPAGQGPIEFLAFPGPDP